MTVTLLRHRQALAMATLGPDAPEPDWAHGGLFQATIRTARGVLVVCPSQSVPLDVESHGPFTAFELAHDIDPSEPALLSALGAAPGRVGISLLPYTTFDRGWLLVQRADADKVQELWERQGFTIIVSEEES